MTIGELSQLYCLSKEVEEDCERLRALRAKASSPTGANLSGMPGNRVYENRLERYVGEIVDLENEIILKIARCFKERQKLERYIASIPDSLTRRIFTYRFVHGLSWRQVAFHVGGGNTEDSVKKTAYRYIRKSG